MIGTSRLRHLLRPVAGQVAWLALIFIVPLSLRAEEEPATFGFGSEATPEEIAAWDIDVRPDGKGLPEGSGTVASGATLYAALCSVCHGKTGVEGPNDRLVVHSADEAFPDASDPETWRHRTVGNYWPYATTLYDYIFRAMPQNIPGSLSPNQTYALTAYLLYLNGIVQEETELNQHNLPQVRMPARDKFVVDDRLQYKVVR
jgi:mono/diheme cytochrome c family protein